MRHRKHVKRKHAKNSQVSTPRRVFQTKCPWCVTCAVCVTCGLLTHETPPARCPNIRSPGSPPRNQSAHRPPAAVRVAVSGSSGPGRHDCTELDQVAAPVPHPTPGSYSTPTPSTRAPSSPPSLASTPNRSRRTGSRRLAHRRREIPLPGPHRPRRALLGIAAAALLNSCSGSCSWQPLRSFSWTASCSVASHQLAPSNSCALRRSSRSKIRTLPRVAALALSRRPRAWSPSHRSATRRTRARHSKTRAPLRGCPDLFSTGRLMRGPHRSECDEPSSGWSGCIRADSRRSTAGNRARSADGSCSGRPGQ